MVAACDEKGCVCGLTCAQHLKAITPTHWQNWVGIDAEDLFLVVHAECGDHAPCMVALASWRELGIDLEGAVRASDVAEKRWDR